MVDVEKDVEDILKMAFDVGLGLRLRNSKSGTEEFEKMIDRLERERIEFLLLEDKVDEAFDLLKKILKRKIIVRWLSNEGEK